MTGRTSGPERLTTREVVWLILLGCVWCAAILAALRGSA